MPAITSADVIAGNDIYAVSYNRLRAELLTARPIGEIRMWPTTSAPEDFLVCQGQAISRTTYASLFAVISTTFGVGDGSTTFNLPDLQGRVAVGRKTTDTDFDTMGETGGAKTHTLSSSEIPAHTHSIPQLNASVNAIFALGSAEAVVRYSGALGNATTTIANTSGSTGGGGAHNNVQPYQVLDFIIRYQ